MQKGFAWAGATRQVGHHVAYSDDLAPLLGLRRNGSEEPIDDKRDDEGPVLALIEGLALRICCRRSSGLDSSLVLEA